MILESAGVEIGVQVKRYRNRIKVEQIRALAGALVLRGLTKGVFVTTSDFQRGVDTTTRRYAARGIGIELLNSERFYDALRLGQLTSFHHAERDPHSYLTHLALYEDNGAW